MTEKGKLHLDGKSRTVKTLFNRSTTVSILIHADLSCVWSILTNAEDFARWNSTIISLKGEFAKGKKLIIQSDVDLYKKSIYRVVNVTPEKEMVWGFGNPAIFKSKLTYSVEQTEDGASVFIMSEVLSGFFAPFVLMFTPGFDETFSQFAADLKEEAEIIQKANNLLTSLQN
ncbi:SRPBCC domain-containing protein [Aureispira]|nr:SRPBCC domain-containing protein [Aureispira sp.]